MPLFRKKPKYNVNIVSIEEEMIFTGTSTIATDSTIVSDASEVQKKLKSISGDISNIRRPVGQGVITYHQDEQDKYEYFVGIRTKDDSNDRSKFVIKTLPIGIYAKVCVYYNNAMSWPIDIAKARRFFQEKWLPSSGYVLGNTFADMEYYPNMEKVDLYFPLIKE